MSFLQIKERAQRLKLEALALGLAVKHPQTPWYARLVIAGLVAYVVTPVDLVPDFIPILGFIDDLIFVPVALGLAVKLVPAAVLADCRTRAVEVAARHRLGRRTWIAVAAAWLMLATLSVAIVYSRGL
jgi:uncharacterized membrane protein YkvA (DUF1232 family)